MTKGIKETKELLEGVKTLAVSVKKITKDGVSLADLPEALELIKKVDILIEAVKDVDGITEEVKDLDQAELIELGVAVFDIVKAIKEA